MLVRFLMPVSMVKIQNNETESQFSANLDQIIKVDRIVETDDSMFVDIYTDNGIIKGINRSIIEVFKGVIEPYNKNNELIESNNEYTTEVVENDEQDI